MKDRVFLDSNILVYSYSKNEIEKQTISRSIITQHNSFISTQVLQELTNIITKKFNFSFPDAQKVINECCQNNNLHINTQETVSQACNIAQEYGFSFYDSLIVSAALESGCDTLYTEDLQHNQKIKSILVIVNPFIRDK